MSRTSGFGTSKPMLLSLFSIIVIDLIGFGIVIPILPFYAETYGANATVLGLLLTSYAAMQFVGSPLWGRLSDRIGRRPVMIITIFGAGTALFLLGLADSLLWLFIARILAGVFSANISVASAYVSDITTEENRTQGMGLIGAAFGIGFVLGPALGGLLAVHSYHLPMFVAAGLSLINGVYAWFVLKEPPRHHRTAADRLEAKTFKPLANPFVRRLCFINLFFTIGVTQLEAVFAFFMMDRFGYDARQVAWILVLMALIMAGIQGGAIRRLSHRFGERGLLVTGLILLAVSFATIPEMPKIAWLLLPLACSAVGRGISQPAQLSMVSRGSSHHTRGAVMGTFQSSASLARIIGPGIAGFLYDQSAYLPFWTGGALMLVVLALAWPLPADGHTIPTVTGEVSALEEF